jgi:hypothetical protein
VNWRHVSGVQTAGRSGAALLLLVAVGGGMDCTADSAPRALRATTRPAAPTPLLPRGEAFNRKPCAGLASRAAEAATSATAATGAFIPPVWCVYVFETVCVRESLVGSTPQAGQQQPQQQQRAAATAAATSK